MYYEKSIASLNINNKSKVNVICKFFLINLKKNSKNQCDNFSLYSETKSLITYKCNLKKN